jgi:biotin synthase-like enzyme
MIKNLSHSLVIRDKDAKARCCCCCCCCGLCSAQYYQLLRLGRMGYERIMHNLDTIAQRLADGILATGVIE